MKNMCLAAKPLIVRYFHPCKHQRSHGLTGKTIAKHAVAG